MSLLKDKIELDIQEAELETQKALSGLPTAIRVAVIVLAIGIIPGYYIAKGVSHSLWLKRLSQGQLMAKPSFTNPKNPGITPVTLSNMGSGNYAAVVKVTNQNLDLSLDNAAFDFTFYNAQKQKLYDFSGQTFLLPNQSKYIVAPR